MNNFIVPVLGVVVSSGLKIPLQLVLVIIMPFRVRCHGYRGYMVAARFSSINKVEAATSFICSISGSRLGPRKIWTG